MTQTPKAVPRRKGARRMAEIPPAVLNALNEGRDETVTLVEWLAIDIRILARAMAGQIGAAGARETLGRAADALADQSISARTKGMGAALRGWLAERNDRDALAARLAAHGSDTVRMWTCYARVGEAGLGLKERLARGKPFAADRAMSVRESAWDALRPFLAENLSRAFKLLERWVRDRDPNVRRCAVEGTRPRGVWCAHLAELRKDPDPGLALLEPLRADPHRYVQTSVANWLNDASKDHPDWVRKVAARWLKESKADATRWIANHATRTLRKRGAVRSGC
ncbi:MAG: DNA alkylation repair protein [Planctomycetota bacterium]|nr:DNA alkylation repair protein [Planctomycetota bacterium]